MGQKVAWLRPFGRNSKAFDVATNKKGWEVTAKRAEKWYDRIEVGVERLMDERYKDEGGDAQKTLAH